MAKLVAALVGIAAVGLLSAGCEDDFDPASLLTTPRILTTRVQVDGEPARNWAAPGESVNMTAFVPQASGDVGPFTWALGACVGVPSPVGGRACLSQNESSVGDFFAFVSETMPQAAFPSFSFTYPEREAFGDSDLVLVFGVVCPRGVPNAELLGTIPTFETGVCTDNSVPGSVWVTSLQLPSEVTAANLNPSLQGLTFVLGEQPWLPLSTAVPAAGCADFVDPGLLQLTTAESPLSILFANIDSSMLETFDRLVDNPPRLVSERESLTISSYTTAGELEGLFTVIEEGPEGEPPPESAATEWTRPLPEELDPTGTRVDFHFVLRDQRGGADWASRSLCIVPALGSEGES